MSISASDLRLIKKAICDRLSAVADVGQVLPSRMTFMDRSEYWATVEPKKKQKDIETDAIAFATVHVSTPRRRVDELNDKTFAIDYTVRMFREAFPARVDETAAPDTFRKKLLESEDTFDAACVNVGLGFREPFEVAGLSADLNATVLAMDTGGAEVLFGEPDWMPTVSGHHLEVQLSVEAIYDDC